MALEKVTKFQKMSMVEALKFSKITTPQLKQDHQLELVMKRLVQVLTEHPLILDTSNSKETKMNALVMFRLGLLIQNVLRQCLSELIKAMLHPQWLTLPLDLINH
jgi:hypothetical protein